MQSAGLDLEGMLQGLTGVLFTWGLRVIGALAVLIIGWIVAKAIRGSVRKALTSSGLDDTLVPFISSLVYYLVLTFVILAVLRLFGLETTSLIAVLGAAGLAVGLALQGTLSNFAAGVMLLIFRPFKVGDFVEAGGTAGTVQEISIFSHDAALAGQREDHGAQLRDLRRGGQELLGQRHAAQRLGDRHRLLRRHRQGRGDDRAKILDEDARVLKDPAPVDRGQRTGRLVGEPGRPALVHEGRLLGAALRPDPQDQGGAGGGGLQHPVPADRRAPAPGRGSGAALIQGGPGRPKDRWRAA